MARAVATDARRTEKTVKGAILVIVLIVAGALAACTRHGLRCDGALEPINSAANSERAGQDESSHAR